MTIEPIKKKVSPEEITKMVKASPWKAKGVVLHNTWLPGLKMVEDYLAGSNRNGKNPKLKKYTEGQLIDNWWVSYKRMKWAAGPHLFIFPTGIFIATPLSMRGTHSPSFNATHYGVEMIGEYDSEELPYTIKMLTAQTLQCLFKGIGVSATNETLKFHGEDPRTSHKGCPGKNARNKNMWLTLIKDVK
jgi:hypothetical protein